jgi:hypothetical protein
MDFFVYTITETLSNFGIGDIKIAYIHNLEEWCLLGCYAVWLL